MTKLLWLLFIFIFNINTCNAMIRSAISSARPLVAHCLKAKPHVRYNSTSPITPNNVKDVARGVYGGAVGTIAGGVGGLVYLSFKYPNPNEVSSKEETAGEAILVGGLTGGLASALIVGGFPGGIAWTGISSIAMFSLLATSRIKK